MATFGLTTGSSLADVIGGVNYLLSTQTSTPPNENVLTANTITGAISVGTSGVTVGYMYQYLFVRYATSADGSVGFSTSPTNATYYGIYNTPSTTASSNPTDYVWYKASGGFGTTKQLYYIVFGGAQVSFYVGTSAPSVDWQVVPVTGIDLTNVTSITVANGSITASQILNNTLTSAQIQLNGITGNSIANQTLTGNLIALNTITGNLIVPGTIYGNAIMANTMNANAIISNSITAAQIAAGTITAGQIAAGTITGNNIAAGTIVGTNIAANTITATQLQTGLLISGNIVSFNANIGNTSSNGYWLNYATGDARFGGNVNIGNNLTVQGLITAGNINDYTVQTGQVANAAITNTVTATYAQLNWNIHGQYYKRPKLVNYNNTTNGLTSNIGTVILAATIIPTTSDSVLKVSYDLSYNNDTGNVTNAGVKLLRSQNEGLNNPYWYSSGSTRQYYPYQPSNFRKVRMAVLDNNNTGTANSYVVVGGYDNLYTYSLGTNQPTAPNNITKNDLLGTVQISGNGNITGSFNFGNSSYPSVATWANTSMYYYDTLSPYTGTTPLLADLYNGNVYIKYENQFWHQYANDFTYQLFGQANVSGAQVAHPYLAATTNFVISTAPGASSKILRYANDSDDALVANATMVIEATSNTTNLNKIATSIAPYSNTRTSFSAVAVGDAGTFMFGNNRVYSTTGTFVSANAWVTEYPNFATGTTNTIEGNLYGVAYSGQTGVMSYSSYTQGAGADANATVSNTYVAVGENGTIMYRVPDTLGTGSPYRWYPTRYQPLHINGITLRSVCYDAYRLRWWAVGDCGTILWADDRSSYSFAWNTYNSGTMRNLYDITWDPLTTNWVAVGDGIVIVDNGQTSYNGQKCYPIGKAYAYDAVAGYYGNLTQTGPAQVTSYEPVPILTVENFPNNTAYDGYNEINQLLLYGAPQVVSANTVMSMGEQISGTYTEIPNLYQPEVQFSHYAGVPVTFYLVATSAASANVIVGSPSITITEFKR